MTVSPISTSSGSTSETFPSRSTFAKSGAIRISSVIEARLFDTA